MFLSTEFGIGKSTVHDIVRHKDKLRRFVAEQEQDIVSPQRRRMQRADDELLDRSVYLWSIQARTLGSPVSGLLIQEKVKMLYQQLYPDADKDCFKATHGWLKTF